MKGLIVFSNGMEDSEALSTLALLRRSKLEVDSATINKDLKVKTGYGVLVYADYNLANINLNDYDFLIIPGGGYVSSIIDNASYINDTIMHFYNNEKMIAAICAAPRFLGRLGLLDNKAFTAFPGSEIDAPKGTYLKDKKSYIDGLIITGRSAGAIVEFSYEIVKYVLGETKALALLTNIIY